MLLFIVKRLILFLPTLLGAITVNFILIQCLPGGPVEHVLAETYMVHSGELRTNAQNSKLFVKSRLNAKNIDALNARFEFDKPLLYRFGDELLRLLSFQFGDSYFYHKPVRALILEKLPVSCLLGLISFLITYLLCVPLGVLRAVTQGSYFDKMTGVLVVLAHALPSFTLGTLLIVFFCGGSFFHIFPIRGLVSDHFETLQIWGKITDLLYHLCLPTLCISFANLAFMSTLTRNVVLDFMKQDFVRMARLKGLPEFYILGKHVLPHAAFSLITGFGTQFFSLFLTSSLLIETLFSLDGMGLLSYESILHRDYPVVMANLYLMSLMIVLGNLLSDLLYTYMDPRITFSDNDA